MRKVDYLTLANILNQDIRHSMEYHDWHLMKALNSESKADTAMHSENVRYYEKRKTHTIDLTRTIARNIGVDKKEFLKACGLDDQHQTIKGSRFTKQWIVAKDDGLRYYR